MRRICKYSLPMEKCRSYMRAIRELLSINQHHLAILMDELYEVNGNESPIRESTISKVEAKNASYEEIFNKYACCIDQLIEESGHDEETKKIMRTLLQKWIEA